MAKQNKPKVQRSPQGDGKSIVIQEINIGQVYRGNQSIQTWINALKAAESAINPNRRTLLNTYHDAAIDGQLTALVEKRILALQTIPFEWNGLKDEKIIENFASPWFSELLRLIGLSIFEGYSLAEVLTGEDSLISDVVRIPPANILPHKKKITIHGWGDETNAIDYTQPPFENLILEIGKPEDLGLYAVLAPYVLMKRDNLADFSRFNEMFGMPLRWYEYDPTDPTARAKVTEAAEKQGSAAYVVVPKGTVVNFVDAAKTGQSAYEPFHDLMNREMSIVVLGQTLTTQQTNVGSNALGKIHQQVESEIAMKDRIMAEYLLNYRFKNKILIPMGYPMQGVKGAFKLTEEISQQKKMEMWIKMADAGLPIAQEDFYNEFGVPMPNGRETLDKPTAPIPPTPVRDSNDPDDPDDDDGGDDDETDPKLSASGKAGTVGMRKALQALYDGQCKHRHKLHSLHMASMDELNGIIEQLITQLWNRQPSDAATLTALFEKELAKAVNMGYGAISTAADQNMIDALLADVKVFSGFKTEAFLREATSALVDETGALRTFAAFRDEILKLNNQYNVTWLQAEYNHAVGSAQMASKWTDIMATKETLPLLQYLTAGDARVRQSHRGLDKIILPADHPFWDTYMPPNDWNCRCNVRQLASGDQTILRQDLLPQLKDEFKFNPGKMKMIFPPNHPYRQQ